MRRIALLVLAAAVAIVVALPAEAVSTQEFKAQFHDWPLGCPPGVDICGKGVVNGFGTGTTTLTFTGIAPGPGAACVTATADRVVTLDSDGSTLRFALTGTICGQDIAGTFTIEGGTGMFTGASGGGTISGVAILGKPSDSVHFRGTLSLP